MRTKIAIKSDKLTPFGGIFYVLDQFDRFIGRRVDAEFGLRCASYGYQYSEIFRALFSVFLCGGTRIEDINAYLKDDLLSRPNTMVPSSDTILTNDWNMQDEQVIRYYNERGASERVFDQMNNDFGWSSLPKSFMNENAVFLLITAMAHNFYHYLVSIPLMALFGIKPTSRIKRFIFKFISVPAKWIKTARTYMLKFYTNRPYDKIFAFE